jgi:hypothetical protein
MVGCVKLTEEAFRANSTEVNFAPVPSLCTSGILGIIRNPVYSSAMFSLSPGVIIASNSLYMVFTHVIMASYIIFHVVPTEEAFLNKLFPTDFTNYLVSTPKFLPQLGPVSGTHVVLGLLAIHFFEFLWKFPIFVKRKEGLAFHFLMTMAWGYHHWLQLD